jgi:hypothetical protein
MRAGLRLTMSRPAPIRKCQVTNEVAQHRAMSTVCINVEGHLVGMGRQLATGDSDRSRYVQPVALLSMPTGSREDWTCAGGRAESYLPGVRVPSPEPALCAYTGGNGELSSRARGSIRHCDARRQLRNGVGGTGTIHRAQGCSGKKPMTAEAKLQRPSEQCGKLRCQVQIALQETRA